MRVSPILTVMSLVVLSGSATASAATNQLDLTGGVAPISRTDRLLSPLQYTGTLPSFELGWSLRQRRAVQHASLGLEIGGLRSGPDWSFSRDGDPRESSATVSTLVDVRYAYGRQLLGGAWDVRVGAVQYSHLEQHDWVYAFTGSSTYLGAFELAPWVNVRTNPGRRHHVELEAWTPLLTWVARSPYAVHDDGYIWRNRDTNAVAILFRHIGAGGLHTPMSYQAVHARGSWSIDLSDHLAVLVSSQFDLFHFTEPQPLAELQLSVTAGVRGSF